MAQTAIAQVLPASPPGLHVKIGANRSDPHTMTTSQDPASPATQLSRRFCVAPMLDITDSHCRVLLRLLSRHAVLYTEMITAQALAHRAPAPLLDFNPSEHPVALQLGGSDTGQLAAAARLGQQWGYDEINLNVGCPSDRVQSGRFGACLMAEPALVADCISAMRDACTLPVTVKHRIGIDDLDSYGFLCEFVGTVAASGCSTFIAHARKAWLKGLSPKENREIPPLSYDTVFRLKRDFPELEIIINGGIKTLQQCEEMLNHVDGAMVGREAYDNPWLLAGVDHALYGESAAVTTRDSVFEAYLLHVEAQLARGEPLMRSARHLLGLYQGLPGARRFRRHLSENGHRKGAGLEVLQQARALIAGAGEQ